MINRHGAADTDRDNDADADRNSEASFPASDPPASWSSPPGHDPVVRPAGAGPWRPRGTDPAVGPAEVATAARLVSAWRWCRSEAEALTARSEVPAAWQDGTWKVPATQASSGLATELPELGWVVVDGDTVLVFDDVAFRRWCHAVGAEAPQPLHGRAPQGRPSDAAALADGFD